MNVKFFQNLKDPKGYEDKTQFFKTIENLNEQNNLKF